MFVYREIKDSIYWVGVNDKRLELFENMFPIPNGVSYNSYIIMDDKTVLMDTVDSTVRMQYLENVKAVLKGRKLDYLVVNHMEPDHCSTIDDIVALYPDVKLIGNTKTFEYIDAFYGPIANKNYQEVSEGTEIELGKHKLTFFAMPMVHWPEVMVAYESTTKTLFSADAFGSFGTINGHIFNDEINFEESFEDDARRYYSNIVGKYGPQAQNALKKLGGLDIETIAPLHGLVWRSNLGYILGKYQQWTTYTPEKKGVVIAYGSMYGNTENVAYLLASHLAKKGVKDIQMFDVSKTDASYIVSAIWKYSHLIFAAPTYNAGLYPPMKSLFGKLEAVGFQNRQVGLIGNYTWHSNALNCMKESLSCFKDITLVEPFIDIKSSIKENNMSDVEALTNALVKTLL